MSSCGIKQINSFPCGPVIEGLLGAAASLETSSENPAALKCHMRASIRADGTIFRPRLISDSVETVDLGGMERTGGGPHNVKVGVGTTAVTATMELSVLLLLLGWLVISE